VALGGCLGLMHAQTCILHRTGTILPSGRTLQTRVAASRIAATAVDANDGSAATLADNGRSGALLGSRHAMLSRSTAEASIIVKRVPFTVRLVLSVSVASINQGLMP
jgi:hypothetical protein